MSYDTLRAVALEPLAIEPLQVGTFSYPIAGGETKLLLGSFATRVGTAGRLEQRDPRTRAYLLGL